MGSSASRDRPRRRDGSGGGVAGAGQGQGAAAGGGGGGGGGAAAATQRQQQQQQRQQQLQQQQYRMQQQQVYQMQQGWLSDPRQLHVLLGLQQQLAFQQQQQRHVPVPQVRQQTTTVKNLGNLKKPTLKLIKCPHAASVYGVEFHFDCLADVMVTVWFMAREADGVITSEYPGPTPLPRRFVTGLNQVFTLPFEEGLDVSRVRVADLVRTPGEGAPMPMIIDLRVADAAMETAQTVSMQLSFCVLVSEGGSFSAKILKQKIKSGGVFYDLQSVYGIQGSDKAGTDDSTKECVICLSAPSDTAVLPCRHMCMCIDCANVLRMQTNKCPVCRAPVESILQIRAGGADGGGAAAGAPPPPPAQQPPLQYQTQPTGGGGGGGGGGGYPQYATEGGRR